MNRNTRLLLVGMIIALSIAALAPFLASSNPDGLESTAGEMDEAGDKEADYYNSPMPDYVFPGQKDEEFAGLVAIVVGTIFMLLIALAFFSLTSKKNKKSIELSGKGETDVPSEHN